MKLKVRNEKTIIGSLAALLFCFLIPHTAFGQTEKLGNVVYSPPKGMTKTLKENVVAFSEHNQTTGRFCSLGLTTRSHDA